MAENVFEVFMAQHPPSLNAVHAANDALWEASCLEPMLKERMRIAGAEAIGCSYCARFRTQSDGREILAAETADDAAFETRIRLAEQFMVGAIERRDLDGLIAELQEHFSPAEFADLVFSVGWFIGMQHVGRFMHWDNACPVAPIRQLVEQGVAR
jgi:alkylhydroperoxidase family enzyme